MTPLENLSVARFRGEQAGDFLQNQLSADISALAPGEAGFACCCTPKGQVIGLLLVCRQDVDFLVVGAAKLMPQLLSRLKMFVFRTRVEFFEETGLTVYGTVPDKGAPGPGVFQPHGVGLGYRFSDQAPADSEPQDAFKALEIGRHVVWLGAETTEKFIPQMLGFEQIGAVSFSKGCYPGQEIVARARYLGKVKRGPVIVRTADPLSVKPSEKVELMHGEAWSSGLVIDSAPEGDGTILFIVAPTESGDQPIEIRYGDRSYLCATM